LTRLAEIRHPDFMSSHCPIASADLLWIVAMKLPLSPLSARRPP
jgi:hypothetical protein